jgi:hypothetical protein
VTVASVLLALACACVASGCANSRVSAAGWTTNSAPPPASKCNEADYPGPWIACPDAAWVRGIAEAAGYEVVDHTGSALVARGQGASFYIWAARGVAPRSEQGRVLCRVGDLDVRGTGWRTGDWRSWRAQGFNFWISAGPTADSTSPDACSMGALIRQSLIQPPPG